MQGIYHSVAATNYEQFILLQISDFGMSRGLENDSYYVSRGGMIPVKWTAPEASHVAKKQSKTSVLESTIMIRFVYLYLSIPRKCILLGKHPCTAFHGVNVAASIQMYAICIHPCGLK